MNIARPRLLAGSLVTAVLAIVAIAVVMAGQRGSSSDDVDARLTPGVVTFPNDGLGNGRVEGDPMPLVSVGDRDGNEVGSASFLGQPLVINFWYSTCAPCAKELPDFAEVHAEVGDEVRFIGINPQDSIETMERFANDKGVKYELYRDDFEEFTNAIRAVAFPITLFVTPDGVIVEQTGVLDADELRSQVDRLMEVSA